MEHPKLSSERTKLNLSRQKIPAHTSLGQGLVERTQFFVGSRINACRLFVDYCGWLVSISGFITDQYGKNHSGLIKLSGTSASQLMARNNGPS